MSHLCSLVTRILLLSFIFIPFLSSMGQTIIPAGNVSGTWTKAESPYVIDGSIVIAANEKLVIESGVEVRFSGNYSLSVQGCLDATGSESDSIRFTVTDISGFNINAHTGWGGIRFQNVVHADSSAIVYCVVEYGKAEVTSEAGSGAALFTKNFGRIKIRNSTLRNNRSYYGGAIAAIETGELRLQNLSIRGNHAAEYGGGIYAVQSKLTLNTCKLINNTGRYGGGGIYVANESVLVLKKSVLIGNKGGALKAHWLCEVNINNSTVAGNTGSPDGLDLYRSYLVCKNSILWNKTNNNTYPEIEASNHSTVSLEYSLVKGTIENSWKAKSVITKDPRFTNLPNFDATLGWTGYPIKDLTRSGAIDTGDPMSPLDPDGTIADIGALPYTQTSQAFPTVIFVADTTQGLFPLAIQFFNYTTQAQGEIVSWKWNFGDNTGSTEKSPSHEYVSAGVFDVKLVATNQDGKKDSLTFTKYIKSLAGTIINTPNVEGTWTKQNSPYNIYKSTTVPAGKALVIEPGVEVRFFGPYALNVNGTLLARGTPTDSIVFDQFDNKSSWHSIRIENVTPGSDSTIFEYCRIAHTRYLGGDVNVNGGNAVFVKDFDKVRVSNCLLRHNHGGRGAGVFAERANIMINDNVIRNNLAGQFGAGIYVNLGSPVISRNRIEKNYANDGAAGIWLSASNSKVENNIISYNSSHWDGAGIKIIDGSRCTLVRNLISYNVTESNGGGLYVYESSPKIIHNTIAYNKARSGEGVEIANGSAIDFTNNIIYYNRDLYQNVNQDDEIKVDGSSKPNFYGCNIEGGMAGIGEFNGIAKDNINAAPLFRNPGENDLSLTWHNYPTADHSKSPCVDAGLFESKHDPDGSRADIGALYFHQASGKFPPRVDYVADTLLGVNSLPVTFSDLSDKGNSDIIEWRWDFGDGGTSSEQNPVHEYKTEGIFSVKLTIKDGNGFEREIVKEKYIRLVSGTYLKGNVAGVFEAKRYIVGGDLLVEELNTLEIEPGAELIFLGSHKLEVKGALRAIGTRMSPIVFEALDTAGLDLRHAATADYVITPGGWAGIRIYASGPQDSTVIDHCKVRFVENYGHAAINAFAANGAAGIRISNSEISYNSTNGVMVSGSDVIVRNNYIHHNYISYFARGAGIFITGSSKIVNNIITNNEASGDGGGICAFSTWRPLLIGNVIMYNKADRGGGIADFADRTELINNTIAYNISTGTAGGGYYMLYAGDVKFTNNIITKNLPVQIEIGDPYSRIGLRNCILKGGSTSVAGYKTNIFSYENVLTDDPKLIQGNKGFGRLLPGSVAVDGGTTQEIASLLPSRDVLGNTRITNTQIDIGACEYVPDPPILAVNPIPDYNKEEDFEPFTVSLESVFEYLYGDKFLTYRIHDVSSVSRLKVVLQDENLHITSIADKFGDQEVTVTASSGDSETSLSFIVHIAPVDDNPSFSIAADMVLAEDFVGSKRFPITVNIPAGEEDQSRSFVLEPPMVDFVNVNFSSDGTLLFSAKPNLFGFQEFTLTLTEEQKTYSQNFTLAVEAVNDSPVIIVESSPLSIDKGSEKNFVVTLFDEDDDELSFSSVVTNSFITATNHSTDVNKYIVNVMGRCVGESGVELRASDGDATVFFLAPVNVVPEEDFTQFNIEGDVALGEDFVGTRSYPIDVIVPDGKENAARSFKLEPSAVDFVNVEFSPGGTLFFTSKPNLFGSQRFTLTLEEEQMSFSRSFTLTVLAVNDPPVIEVEKSSLMIPQGKKETLQVVISDVDGDDVTFAAHATNSSSSVTSNEIGESAYSVTVAGEALGSSGIELSASDGKAITNLGIAVSVVVVTETEAESLPLEVYPNPSTDYFILRTMENSLVTVYDTKGQVVIQELSGRVELKLDARDLTPGLYLLSVISEERISVLKIIKR